MTISEQILLAVSVFLRFLLVEATLVYIDWLHPMIAEGVLVSSIMQEGQMKYNMLSGRLKDRWNLSTFIYADHR